MSGRFVSGGTIGAGDTETVDDGSASSAPIRAVTKSAEWEKAQQQLEAERQRRHDARVKAASGEERSLYDVLQANKAAKEAAAAEASKLTNQFRALDDDEVEFLDEVAARQRQAEESVRRETEQGLKAFRAAATRQKGEKQRGGEGPDGEGQGEEEWGTRKRKRRTERDAGLGVVKRKVSIGEEEKTREAKKNERDDEEMKQAEPVEKTERNEKEMKPKKTALVLVDYGSDSDE